MNEVTIRSKSAITTFVMYCTGIVLTVIFQGAGGFFLICLIPVNSFCVYRLATLLYKSNVKIIITVFSLIPMIGLVSNIILMYKVKAYKRNEHANQ